MFGIVRVKKIEIKKNTIFVNGKIFANILNDRLDFSDSDYDRFDRVAILTSREWKRFINRNILPPEKQYISVRDLLAPKYPGRNVQ